MGDEPDLNLSRPVAGEAPVNVAMFVHQGLFDAEPFELLDQEFAQTLLLLRRGGLFVLLVGFSIHLDVGKEPLQQIRVFSFHSLPPIVAIDPGNPPPVGEAFPRGGATPGEEVSDSPARRQGFPAG